MTKRMIKHIDERRSDPRLANNVPVKICQEDGDLVSQTQNISRSGAYCHVERFIAPMTKLKVHLMLTSPDEGRKKSRKISCDGVVVRSEPVANGKGYNLAIFFSDISKNDATAVTDYVNAYLQNKEAV